MRIREVRETGKRLKIHPLLWDEGWPWGTLWQCLIPEAADPALSP